MPVPSILNYNKGGGTTNQTQTVSFTAASVVGNEIILGIFLQNATGITPVISTGWPTDNAATPNTYTVLQNWTLITSGAINYYMAVYTAPITSIPASGDLAVTVKVTLAPVKFDLLVAEIQGQAASPIDSGSLVVTNNAGSTAVSFTTPIAVLNELLLAFVQPGNALTAGTNWTLRVPDGNNDSLLTFKTTATGSQSFTAATLTSAFWQSIAFGIMAAGVDAGAITTQETSSAIAIGGTAVDAGAITSKETSSATATGGTAFDAGAILTEEISSATATAGTAFDTGAVLTKETSSAIGAVSNQAGPVTMLETSSAIATATNGASGGGGKQALPSITVFRLAGVY